MKMYTCTLLVFVVHVVCTQATCISKTAIEFDNICYEFFTTKMNWAEAQKYCSNFNGPRSLAKVSSPSVLNFFNSLRPSDKIYEDDGKVWLGASDQLKEGEWVWTDGTKAYLKTMWGYWEPNNLGGNEDCLQIASLHLNDDECHENFSFICMEVHGNLTSLVTTAAIIFTTEGNSSKTGNISMDTLEKSDSIGLAEWIGIGIGIGVVVTLSLFAVVRAIKCRRKTQSLNENYENMTRTEDGRVQLVELDVTKHVYAECLDK